jgi:hypothetical protein
MAVARKVEERWKRVKIIKRGEKASDAREILLGVLETLEEEMVEAHRVGKLPKKKKKKVEETARKEEETTKDADKKESEAPLNFGEIVAQEMAAKEALWKPKEEEEEEEEEEACQNLSVYETRCPARRNFEMRCEVRTQCVACQDVSVREETMMHLSLDMPSLNSANGSLASPFGGATERVFSDESYRAPVRKVRRRCRGRNAFVDAAAEISTRACKPFRLDEEERRSERQRATQGVLARLVSKKSSSFPVAKIVQPHPSTGGVRIYHNYQ